MTRVAQIRTVAVITKVITGIIIRPQPLAGEGIDRFLRHLLITAVSPPFRQPFVTLFFFVLRTFRKCCKVDDHSAD